MDYVAQIPRNTEDGIEQNSVSDFSVCVCVCVFVEISSVNSHLMDPVRVIVEFGSFVSLDLVTTKEEQAFRGKIGTHLHA